MAATHKRPQRKHGFAIATEKQRYTSSTISHPSYVSGTTPQQKGATTLACRGVRRIADIPSKSTRVPYYPTPPLHRAVSRPMHTGSPPYWSNILSCPTPVQPWHQPALSPCAWSARGLGLRPHLSLSGFLTHSKIDRP